MQAAWLAFRFYSGTQDKERFRQAYIGNWPDRKEFGNYLLTDFGADRYLMQLPRWVQRYVQLDAESLVRDFEAAGYYHVAEFDKHVYVFDAQV